MKSILILLILAIISIGSIVTSIEPKQNDQLIDCIDEVTYQYEDKETIKDLIKECKDMWQ